MTPLAVELARILRDESAFPPMSAVSLVNVLKATGYPHGPAGLQDVEGALLELSAAGQVRRMFSPKAGERWRAVQAVAAVVAASGSRT